MIAGSLFSGIGGFDLGFNMPIAWQVETNKDCLRVLTHHWPETERITDVKKASSDNLCPVDLICGGFPCTDLSVAGKRKGLAGKQSGLWFEFLRIIGELLPSWVLIENVPGLLSSQRGFDFFIILQGLEKLGYHAAWRVLDSQYLGVAQRRRRVFIVASFGSGRCAEVLFEPACLCGNPAPSREKGKEFAGATGGGSEESCRGWRNDLDGNGAYVMAFNHQSGGDIRMMVSEDKANTLQGCQTQAIVFGGKQRSHNEKSSHGWTEERQPCLSGGQDHNLVAFGGNNTSRSINIATACNAHGGTGRHDFESETFVVAPPLTGNPHGDHESGDGLLTVAFTERTRKEGRTLESQSDLAYAIDNPAAGGSAHCRNILHHGAVRRLTPTETLRLQGFPDDWLDLDPPLSDSAKYRMVGNAVTVNVIRWIANRLKIANAENT